jgi:hypothetical protein
MAHNSIYKLHHNNNISKLYNEFNILKSGMPIAIYYINKRTNVYNSDAWEAPMKKFIAMLEDLWVAIAFAEAGVYEPVAVQDLQPRCQDTVNIHAS